MPGPGNLGERDIDAVAGRAPPRRTGLAERGADRAARIGGSAGQPARAPAPLTAGRAGARRSLHDRGPGRLQQGAGSSTSSIRCSRWRWERWGRSRCCTWSRRSSAQRVRDMFSRFVPADVVDQVVASTDENLRLGGVERDCTSCSRDLRGFTSFSETQSARARDRGRQLLPERDDRGDPRRRRHADLLHGRRDHGGVRRAAGAGRPRRPGAERQHGR